MKFFNHTGTGVTTSTPFNPWAPIELAIGPDPLYLNTSGATPDVFCSGQPFLAPQSTPQSNHQIKYDGSRARNPALKSLLTICSAGPVYQRGEKSIWSMWDEQSMAWDERTIFGS